MEGGCLVTGRRSEAGNASTQAAQFSSLSFRHKLGGATISLLPDAVEYFGQEQNQLLGDGLLQRIHVQDRPVFLKALNDSFHNDIAIQARFRIHMGKAETGMPEAGLLLVEALFWPDGSGAIVKSSMQEVRKDSDRSQSDGTLCDNFAGDGNRQRLLRLAQGELLELASSFSVLCQSAIGGADDDIARLQTLRYLSERLATIGNLLCDVGSTDISPISDAGSSSLLCMVQTAIVLQGEKVSGKKPAISVDVAAAVREPVSNSFGPLIEMLLSCAICAVPCSGTIDITTRREGRAATISLILSPAPCLADDTGSFAPDMAIIRNLAIRKSAHFAVSHRLAPLQQWILRLPLIIDNNFTNGDRRSISPVASQCPDGDIIFTKQDKSVA